MEDTNNNNNLEKELLELKKENRLLKLKLFEQNKDEPFDKVLEETLSPDVDNSPPPPPPPPLSNKEETKEFDNEHEEDDYDIDSVQKDIEDIENEEDNEEDIGEEEVNEEPEETKKKPLFSLKSLLTIFLIQMFLLLVLFLSLFFYFFNKQNTILDKQEETKKELEIIQLKSENAKNNENNQKTESLLDSKTNSKDTKKVVSPQTSPNISASPSVVEKTPIPSPSVSPTSTPATSTKPTVEPTKAKVVEPSAKPTVVATKQPVQKATPKPVKITTPAKQTRILPKPVYPQKQIKHQISVTKKTKVKPHFVAKETPITTPPLGLTVKKIDNENFVVLDKIRFDNEEAAKKAKEAFQKNLSKENISKVNLELHKENGQYTIKYKTWSDKKSNTYIKNVGENLEKVWNKTNPTASPETTPKQ